MKRMLTHATTGEKEAMNTLTRTEPFTNIVVERDREALEVFGPSVQFLVAPQPSDEAPCVMRGTFKTMVFDPWSTAVCADFIAGSIASTNAPMSPEFRVPLASSFSISGSAFSPTQRLNTLLMNATVRSPATLPATACPMLCIAGSASIPKMNSKLPGRLARCRRGVGRNLGWRSLRGDQPRIIRR